MPPLSHKACGVRLVAEGDDARVLLNVVSGEALSLSSQAQLKFNEAGWAFIKVPDQNDGAWVACRTLFSLSVLSNGQDEYIADKETREPRWCKQERLKHVLTYPKIQVLAKSGNMALLTLALPLKGQAKYWHMKPMQDRCKDQ